MKTGRRLAMPNWCFTTYVAAGERKQLEELHGIMQELESMQSPLRKNGFGTAWLGNLVIKLGGDWEKIYCRGRWYNLSLTDSGLYFDTETAWCEMSEVRLFLQEKFPGIEIFYQSEESGMGLYETNDITGEYFPEQFLLDVEEKGISYPESLEQLTKEVEEITGSRHLNSYDACLKALKTYSQNHDHCCFTCEPFRVVAK